MCFLAKNFGGRLLAIWHSPLGRELQEPPGFPAPPCTVAAKGAAEGGCRRALQAWWASGPGWGAGRWGEGHVQLFLPSHEGLFLVSGSTFS